MSTGFSQERIRVHGLAWMVVAVLSFAILLSAIILAYRAFIVGRAKNSMEYLTAEFYVSHSLSVRENLGADLSQVEFTDIRVRERDNHGVCELKFLLTLADGSTRSLRAGLVKIADFWLVYNAVLGGGKNASKRLSSTYDKIVSLTEEMTFANLAAAKVHFGDFSGEIYSATLKSYLEAYVWSHEDPARSLKLLEDLENQVVHAKLAVLYLEAQLHYDLKNHARAIDTLKRMEWLYEHETILLDRKFLDGIFASLPKSPFLANMDPDNVMAQARKLMSLSLSAIGQNVESLHWSERAIEQADKIGSSVLRSSSLYLKALSLYDLDRLPDADRAFAEVIADIDNPNLSQKSWAYFFRAEIAARAGRHQDSLDFYELAVTLEPTNAMIREGTIGYLKQRGFVGDLEVALGLAIRGIDYGVDRQIFIGLASELYLKLGIPDRTAAMAPAP